MPKTESQLISLSLPKDLLQLMNDIATGLQVSRTTLIKLSLTALVENLGGYEKVEKAIDDSRLKDLVQKKLGLSVMNNRRYDYKSVN